MAWTRRGVLAAGVAGLAGCVDGGGSATRAPFEAGSADATVGFVGDVMLGRGVTDRWVDRDPAGVWGSTLERLQALDGLVLNLECCLAEGGRRWPEKVYYFRADPGFAVPALRAANATVASLANNHVLDFREPGLESTRSHLTEAGVAHAGAGPGLEAALAPAVTEVGPLTVATVGLTGRYPSYAATTDSPGTAYVRPDPSASDTRRTVRRALARAEEHDPDLVVASLHWGPNWETTPGETREAFAHWLVEQGVDVVHGHSAHVLQGVEIHQGRPIIYDAGDFVDDYIDKNGLYNKRSGLFELVVTDGSLERLRIVPVEIENETATVADGAAAAWVSETVRARSEPFETTVERTDEGVSVPIDKDDAGSRP